MVEKQPSIAEAPCPIPRGQRPLDVESLRQVPDKHLLPGTATLWTTQHAEWVRILQRLCHWSPEGHNPTRYIHTDTYTYTQTHTHIHIHAYINLREARGHHPGSGATRKGLRDDAYLKESSNRETTVHDYNTRERHTVATRLAFKRWILGTILWPLRVWDKCWYNADSLSPSIVSISRVPQAPKGFLKRFPFGIDSLYTRL